jgi:ABC-type transporter Mla MlaB component
MVPPDPGFSEASVDTWLRRTHGLVVGVQYEANEQVRLVLWGELDVGTVPIIERLLNDALPSHASVVVDLFGICVVDAHGLALLLRLGERRDDVSVRLTAPRPRSSGGSGSASMATQPSFGERQAMGVPPHGAPPRRASGCAHAVRALPALPTVGLHSGPRTPPGTSALAVRESSRARIASTRTPHGPPGN